jgi:hypothetical protein
MSFDFLGMIQDFLISFWWIIVPLVFLPFYGSLNTFISQEKKKRETKWAILEIKIPRDVRRTPESMEQVLSTIHGWGGKATDWTSLELVSIGGEVHFYVRVQDKLKAILESSFFSVYHDIEIKEVEDYVSLIPSNTGVLHAQGKDVWGTEIILDKEGAYPIRPYSEFSSGGDEKHFDPISVFIEIMSRVKKDEMIGVQIILMPAKTKDVRGKYKEVIEKLKGQDKDPGADAKPKSTTEAKIARAVETNLSKPIFNTLIRTIYISPKAIFQENYAKQGLLSAFNQYSTPDLNSFKSNDFVAVGGAKSDKFPFIAAASRNSDRKEFLLHKYRHRDIPLNSTWGVILTSTPYHVNNKSKFVELSTESLATIYHLPTMATLTAPFIKRVESKKVGPPAGLAIFGEEAGQELFK